MADEMMVASSFIRSNLDQLDSWTGGCHISSCNANSRTKFSFHGETCRYDFHVDVHRWLARDANHAVCNGYFYQFLPLDDLGDGKYLG